MIPVTLDCETGLIAPGLQAPPLACVAIGDSEYQTVLHHTDWIDTVVDLLEDPNVLIVGHNIAYDFLVMMNEEPWLAPVIFDAYSNDRITCTQVRQSLCDIAGGVYKGFEDIDGKTTKLGYSLEDLAYRHLGLVLDKDTWRLRYGELIPLPLIQWPAGAIDYPKGDIRATDGVFLKQEENAFFLDDQYRQARAGFWLRLMAAWGVRTDAKGIAELSARTSMAYDAIARDLRKVGLLKPDSFKRDGTKVNGSRNTKAAQDRIVRAYTSLGKPVPMTDGGKSGKRKPALDKVSCQESGDPILVKYAEITSLKNFASKDIPMLSAGRYHPIHSWYDVLKETGRVGSAGPNLMNLKKAGGVRECFVPRCLRCSRVHEALDIAQGHCLRCLGPLSVFWSCDYGGLELATLAQACLSILGHSRLAEVLNTKVDPHLMIASQILHRPYDELKDIKKRGAQGDCIARSQSVCRCAYCVMYNARQTGKVANFGFPGGLGAAALVFFALNNYGVVLTENEARDLKRLWLETWPEMKGYFAWISSQTDKPFSQILQLSVGRYRGNVRYTEACNTIFQGLGADIAKASGWLIYRAMYDPTVESILYGSRGNLFVHDEHVGESPEPIAHECALEVRRLMIEAAKPFLPDVFIDVEPALMRRYSKDASTQYDENGRLIPWAA